MTFNNIHIRIASWFLCILLFAAIAEWPYAYYQFLRIAVFFIGGVVAFTLFNEEKIFLAAVTVIGVAVFNPIIPLHMDRENWMVLNIIFGIWFGVAGLNIPKNREAE